MHPPKEKTKSPYFHGIFTWGLNPKMLKTLYFHLSAVLRKLNIVMGEITVLNICISVLMLSEFYSRIRIS